MSATIALKVNTVRWMLDDATPWLSLGSSEGTPMKEEGGELTMPSYCVDELVKNGWAVEESGFVDVGRDPE